MEEKPTEGRKRSTKRSTGASSSGTGPDTDTSGADAHEGAAHTDPHGHAGGEGSSESRRGTESRQDFEDRLDRLSRRFSDTVADGVKRVEEAFEKGKDNLRDDIKRSQGMENLKGSPRMGLILVGLGIVWMLYTFGLFDNVIFPIILIAAGLYFIVRNRTSPPG